MPPITQRHQDDRLLADPDSIRAHEYYRCNRDRIDSGLADHAQAGLRAADEPVESFMSSFRFVLIGGYFLATAAALAMANLVPESHGSLVLIGMMLGFAVYLAVVNWAFALCTAWGSWREIVLPACLCGAAFALLTGGIP